MIKNVLLLTLAGTALMAIAFKHRPTRSQVPRRAFVTAPRPETPAELPRLPDPVGLPAALLPDNHLPSVPEHALAEALPNTQDVRGALREALRRLLSPEVQFRMLKDVGWVGFRMPNREERLSVDALDSMDPWRIVQFLMEGLEASDPAEFSVRLVSGGVYELRCTLSSSYIGPIRDTFHTLELDPSGDVARISTIRRFWGEGLTM